MNTIIELTKSYIFCDNCGKCYIYKGSYEKHNKICSKKIEKTEIIKNKSEESININMKIIDTKYHNDYVDYNKKKYNQQRKLIEIACPVYLFIVFLLLGFIKGMIVGF